MKTPRQNPRMNPLGRTEILAVKSVFGRSALSSLSLLFVVVFVIIRLTAGADLTR